MAKRGKRRRPRSRTGAGPARLSTEVAAGLSYPGARVARVAVDDDTWLVFREICGSTPASVRLGDLVRAEVARAAGRRDGGEDALAALRVIVDQADVLETQIRRMQAARGPGG
jgi:hypothetical protein